MTSNEGCQIMVFKPSLEEFKNFSEYIKYMESKGAHKAGVAKVIPPKEWSAVRRYNMKRIGDMDIKTPVSQTVTGQQGLFQLFNVQKKPMKVKAYKELAETAKYKGPEDSDLEKIERKFWKNVTFNPAIYGADVPGSIYDRDVKYWNINHLNTILDTINSESKVKILGVNTAYLYFGMWKTTFPWHTEDMDLYSINYLHFGAPKSWYAIPPEHGKRMETLAKGFFSGSFQDCPEFMRHKMTMISPQVLRKFSIPVNKVTQYEGEFMITFPYGYHSGYNHGFNCAESTNFASLRWIDFGKKAKYCRCKGDSVKIEMDIFIQKYQPEHWKKILIERRKEKQVDVHNKRKSKRANYSSDSKDTTTEESETSNTESSDEEDTLNDEDEGTEESEEVTDTDSNDEVNDEMPTTLNGKRPNSKNKGGCKTIIPKKSKVVKLHGKQRKSVRQKKLYRTKRHPVHGKEPLEEILSDDKENNVKINQINAGKSTVSSLHGNLLKSIWKTALQTKNKEASFNKLLADTGTKCAVCVYFSQSDADFVANGTQRRPNKRHSLTMLKKGQLLVTELCFAFNNTQDASVESAFHFMFGESNEEELILLTCSTCHVTVHSCCYGVAEAVVPTTKWLCDKCKYVHSLENMDIDVENKDLKQEIISLDYKPVEDRLKTDSTYTDTDQLCGISTDHCYTSTTNEMDIEVLASVEKSEPSVTYSTHFLQGSTSPTQENQFFSPVAETNCTSTHDLQDLSTVENQYSSTTVESHVRSTSISPILPAYTSSIDDTKGDNTDQKLFNCNLPITCTHKQEEKNKQKTCLCYVKKERLNSTSTTSTISVIDSEDDLSCCLCFIKGGALKQTTSGQWCHIVCAIAFPEVFFENQTLRGPVNISNLNPARRKLTCIHCGDVSKNVWNHGACVQCKCGKCATSFHVTCSFHHGIPLYLGDWPVLVETFCPKHIRRKTLVEERVLPEVSVGDMVIAKHKNGRYYKSRVVDITMVLYYKVVFEDKSFCFDLPPEDIQDVDAKENVLPEGETVNILWPDGVNYHAEVTGHWYEAICQVRFEDSSILNIKRSDLYLEDEEIPKRVKSKLSYASETANKLYLPESLRIGTKRARIGTRRCASIHKKL